MTIFKNKLTLPKIFSHFPGFRHDAGFTLAEILIVGVILAVMASLVVPRFAGQAEKAKAMEAISIMGSIRRAVLAYYDKNMTWPQIGDFGAGTPGTADDFRNRLGVTFTAPGYWEFYVVDLSDEAYIKARNRSIAGDTLRLRAKTGAWCGTGNYVPSGKYWPNLQPLESADCSLEYSGP